MDKYQKCAERIERDYRRGLYTLEERDKKMDELTTRLLQEFDA